MLYDPKWEVKTKPDVFSLASLIAWLEKQPATNEYCYMDTGLCLLGRYFTAMGFENVLVGGTTVDHDGIRDAPLPEVLQKIAEGFPRTFGAALERAWAAL